MVLRALCLSVLVVLCCGCEPAGGFHPPTHLAQLPSGKPVRVTSCLLVWGAEHDERFPERDAFALEYVSAVPPADADQLDREALEVFELIRPLSEQWAMTTASVAAFPQAERTGPYTAYEFSRTTSGAWTHTRRAAKVFNTPSGKSWW